ncbi:MAG: hypothetical protein L0170_02745, partial [Acidobacteria bacterium]|nr:hypothetical protein [Acidobacteriota bacterium]
MMLRSKSVRRWVVALGLGIWVAGLNESSEGSPLAAPVDGVLRVHPSNKRYFTDDSGKAIHLGGHQIFCDVQDLWAAQEWTMGPTGPAHSLNWSWYVNYAKARGMNSIRNWVSWSYGWGAQASNVNRYCDPMPFARTGPGTAPDGRPKFNLKVFNQSYFDRMRSRLLSCQDNGIYVGLMLFEVYTFMGNNWPGNLFHPSNNTSGINTDGDGNGSGLDGFYFTPSQAVLDIQRAYVRKVIDTVNDLDNVYFEIANELGASTWQNNLINYIKSYESGKPKRHLILRSAGGRNASAGWTTVSKSELVNSPADIFTIFTNWPGYEQRNPPANNESKPAIWDEDHVSATDPVARKDYRHPWKAFT